MITMLAASVQEKHKSDASTLSILLRATVHHVHTLSEFLARSEPVKQVCVVSLVIAIATKIVACKEDCLRRALGRHSRAQSCQQSL